MKQAPTRLGLGIARVSLVGMLALNLSACNLNIARTKPNWLFWSGGVAYYRCTDQNITTYKGEVQRLVVLGQPIRIDAETLKVTDLKGRCEMSGSR